MTALRCIAALITLCVVGYVLISLYEGLAAKYERIQTNRK